MNENNFDTKKIEDIADNNSALSNELKNSDSNVTNISNPQNSKFAEDFDIADFIAKHSTTYSVKKPRIWTKVIGIAFVAALITALCVTAAVLSNKKSNPVFGKWVSSDGIEMEIIEDYIIINGSSMKYIFEDDNVIALNVNNEYFKMIYELNDGKLTITIPFDEITTIEYTRQSN